VFDAQEANNQADGLGAPADMILYYAVDTDATPSAVRDYFAGAASVGRRPVGIYGSYRVCEAMLDDGTAQKAWQTVAWSHGQVSARAALYQRAAPTHTPIPGTDENACLTDDWGQWPRPTAPPQPLPKEDEMLNAAVFQITENGAAFVHYGPTADGSHQVNVQITNSPDAISLAKACGQDKPLEISQAMSKRLGV